MLIQFDRLNLRTKLGIGFGALIALTLLVGGAAVVTQQRALHTVESFLERENRNVALSMASSAAVLEARRNEQEFMVKVREFSFEEARSRYAALLRLELADAKRNLDLMRTSSDAQTVGLIEELKVSIDAYQRGFVQIVALFGRIKHGNMGFQVDFQSKAGAIESALGATAPPLLTTDLYALRGAEAKIGLHDIGGEANKLQQTSTKFKRDLEAAHLGSARTTLLARLVDEYKDLFGRYVALDSEIDDAITAHHATSHEIMLLLEQLQHNAGADAGTTQAALKELNDALQFTVVGVSLAAIALALLVAIALTRNINRSVRKGVDFAHRLAHGELSARVDWTGDAEFGSLVRAMNGMAESMQTAQHVEQEQAGVLLRVNRTLRVLSQCNCTLVRATSEEELLQSITQNIAETGGYRLVWVGYAQHDERRTIRPVAHGGDDQGMLEKLDVTWADDGGPGISGLAIREHRTVVERDMQNSPRHAAWRTLAVAEGIKSSIALPLMHASSVIGVLVLYAAECDAFDEDEVKLLEELANDLAYGIQALREVQSRRRYEEQLAYQSNYDPLTGLANRNLFRDRVDQALLHATRYSTTAATIKLGLDRFGAVNDNLGTAAGDQMLKDVAGRIAACVKGDDTVARLGGDIFGVAIGDIASEEDLAAILKRIAQAIAQPLQLGGAQVFPVASIGVSLFPRDGENSERQLQNAQATLLRAKALGGGQLRYYAPEMNDRASARFLLEGELRRALESDELVAYYQPKASLKNGRLSGAEALVRWQHPTRGLVMPGEFIALAEETGLIEPIGRWMIDRVCAQLRTWRDEGLPVPSVAVNLSARQFHQDDLGEFIKDTLRKHCLEPQLLELELTESAVMHDVEHGIAVLRKLKATGVKISLDDFGTGQSSLSYLKRLPIDKLKIDQSFVREITTAPDSAAVCIAVIGLAHTLNLTVVAEGVETEGQMNYLRQHDCDELQGYLFGAALCAPDFARMLAAGTSLALPVAASHVGTLLLVDDEPNVLSALRRALRPTGYRVLTAGSALEGFEIMATNDVQVVISDQRMPQMNGTEFLSRVSALYPDTIRMVLTGYTDVDSILESINRGTVFRFLVKPWDDALLLEHINEAFRYHRVASRRDETSPVPRLAA